MPSTTQPAAHLPRRFDELVRLFPPRAIHDEIAYDNTQEMIDRLTSVPTLSKGQADYLDTLTVLLEAYEQEHHAIDPAKVSPIEALRYLLERNDMSVSDLGRLLGDRSLGTRILNGQRALSKSHIQRLCERFKVSPELFFPIID